MLHPKDTASAVQRCRANIAALLTHHGLPQITPEEQLVDRIKGSAPPGFAYLLDSHANFRAFNAVKNHGKTAVRGWRENTPCWSLQVILHRLDRFELDVDRFNPDFGAWYAGRHWLQEVLPNRLGRRKTDPFAVERGLRKRGIPV